MGPLAICSATGASPRRTRAIAAPAAGRWPVAFGVVAVSVVIAGAIDPKIAPARASVGKSGSDVAGARAFAGSSLTIFRLWSTTDARSIVRSALGSPRARPRAAQSVGATRIRMPLPMLILAGIVQFLTPSPDLCADVHRDATGAPITDSVGQTLSRYCEWTGPEPPAWDDDVCCTIGRRGARCTQTEANGGCRVGLRMHCDYGETLVRGEVVCYQPLPDACEAGLCVQAPTAVAGPGQETHVGCCSAGGVCQWATHDTIDQCSGFLVACFWGASNDDGTVDCYD